MSTSWGWRIPSILQGAPALLSLCMVLLLPESPRWLISKDRHQQALNVLAKAHGNGNLDDDLVRAEYGEISDVIRIEAEAARDGIQQLWSTAPNRKRMFIIICVGVFAQWSGRSQRYSQVPYTANRTPQETAWSHTISPKSSTASVSHRKNAKL